MTLGTTREFRRCGLGSLLVNKVVNMIESQEEQLCGALYLHVIVYNLGAIRLYERLGFMMVKKIKGELFYISVCALFDDEYCLTNNIHLIGISLDFSCFFVIDYYTINSVNYDCYLYARYFHGKILNVETETAYGVVQCSISRSIYIYLALVSKIGNPGHQTTLEVLYGYASSIIQKLGSYAFIST